MAEHIAIRLTKNARDHTEWLEIMQFGLDFLLSEQEILLKLIQGQAMKLAADKTDFEEVAAHMQDICRELQLEMNRAELKFNIFD